MKVTWNDASFDPDFDGKPSAAPDAETILEDVGFYCKESRGQITLASCYDEATGTVRWVHTIPKTLIRKIEPLQVRPEVANPR